MRGGTRAGRRSSGFCGRSSDAGRRGPAPAAEWEALTAPMTRLRGIARFLLLVLPGLFVFARWSLFPAVLVLEGGRLREGG